MKINDKEIALLHAPKTGGSSLEMDKRITTFGHMGVYDDGNPNCKRINYTYYYHDTKSARQAILPLIHTKKYYTLFIVRNHFSFLISYFDWVGGFTNWNDNHHDHIIANRGFDYFVKSIINRENAWPSRRYIYCQMWTPSGLLVPDHILHTEILDDEVIELFAQYGEKYTPPPRVQIGRRHGSFGARSAGKGKNLSQSDGKTDKRKPHEMYSDSLASEVYQCWEEEMTLLGYGSDPSDLTSSGNGDILYGEVSEGDKEKWKYIWEKDRR